MDEARLQSIQTGNKGRVGEYEDVQTSGSSFIQIKCSFIVPGVFIKDLLCKNMACLKGNQGPLLHCPPYLLKRTSKDSFVSRKLLNCRLRFEQIWCGTCPCALKEWQWKFNSNVAFMPWGHHRLHFKVKSRKHALDATFQIIIILFFLASLKHLLKFLKEKMSLGILPELQSIPHLQKLSLSSLSVLQCRFKEHGRCWCIGTLDGETLDLLKWLKKSKRPRSSFEFVSGMFSHHGISVVGWLVGSDHKRWSSGLKIPGSNPLSGRFRCEILIQRISVTQNGVISTRPPP